MWILLLAMISFSADPQCEQAHWRLQTTAHLDSDAGNGVQRLAKRWATRCSPSEPAPECVTTGRQLADEVMLARQRASAAAQEASLLPDIKTILIDRAKDNTDAHDARLRARLEQDTVVRAAQSEIVEASIQWNQARCACDSGCEVAPKAAQETRSLLSLYTALLETEEAFPSTWSEAELTARLANSVADAEATTARARALAAVLARTGARPGPARVSLLDTLTLLGGAPDYSADDRRVLVQWKTYEKAWRAYIRSLDKRVATLAESWYRLDNAESKSSREMANRKINRLITTLETNSPPPPASFSSR